MSEAVRKNLCLVLLLGAACLAGWFASRALFWYLTDVENHMWAYLIYFLAALTSCAAALALDAFATVLRFGFVRARKSAMWAFCALVHGAVRILCAFYQGMFVVASVLESILSSGPLVMRLVGPLLLAAVTAGFVLLFRLEKQLKAQRALAVTFD